MRDNEKCNISDNARSTDPEGPEKNNNTEMMSRRLLTAATRALVNARNKVSKLGLKCA